MSQSSIERGLTNHRLMLVTTDDDRRFLFLDEELVGSTPEQDDEEIDRLIRSLEKTSGPVYSMPLNLADMPDLRGNSEIIFLMAKSISGREEYRARFGKEEDDDDLPLSPQRLHRLLFEIEEEGFDVEDLNEVMLRTFGNLIAVGNLHDSLKRYNQALIQRRKDTWEELDGVDEDIVSVELLEQWGLVQPISLDSQLSNSESTPDLCGMGAPGATHQITILGLHLLCSLIERPTPDQFLRFMLASIKLESPRNSDEKNKVHVEPRCAIITSLDDLMGQYDHARNCWGEDSIEVAQQVSYGCLVIEHDSDLGENSIKLDENQADWPVMCLKGSADLLMIAPPWVSDARMIEFCRAEFSSFSDLLRPSDGSGELGLNIH